MKSLSKNFGKSLLAGAVIFLASCNKDNDNDNSTNPNVTPKSTTVKGVLEEEARYSHMNEAVEESGHSTLFADANANITLFAANNSAFEKLFAKMNVSSVAELKSQMGDERFANLILYHALTGKFTVSDFNNDFEETNAESDNGSHLDVLIVNENNARLVFNGNDENGASSVSNVTISAQNGSVIEINGILEAQSTFENMEEGDREESTYMVNFMANADASVKAMLENKNEVNTIMAGNKEEVEAMLSLHISNILDVQALENLLDNGQKTTLLSNFGVSVLADLMADLKIDDLIALNINLAQILSVMDKDDNTKLMNSFIFSGNLDKDAMISKGSITSRSGISFDVSSNTQGNLVLTDADGNKFILDSESTQSVNGSVYTITEVQEQ